MLYLLAGYDVIKVIPKQSKKTKKRNKVTFSGEAPITGDTLADTLAMRQRQ